MSSAPIVASVGLGRLRKMEHIARAPRLTASEVDGETLRPGDLLMHGQYRIERYIGAGGFGITYRARDCLDRGVVIKECFPNAICTRENNVVRTRSNRLQPEFEALVREFGLEARRMARLAHPNIVGVHQVFEDNGTAYMALDLVPGRDLLEIVESDRDELSPDQIKDILKKLLSAIAYLHDRDILHRDISPDNVLVDQEGNPVLIDFGAAHETAARSSALKSALQMVKDGYSPQEFYLGTGDHGPFSDLYSLAATFYHVITGKMPADSQQRLAAVAQNKPDPLQPIPMGNSGYDRYFLEAIHRGLEIFPDDRMETARDWLRLIDEAQRQEALADEARRNMEINRTIKHLTVETNRAIAALIQAEIEAEERRKAEEEENRASQKETPLEPLLGDEDDILRQPLEEELEIVEDEPVEDLDDVADLPPQLEIPVGPVDLKQIALADELLAKRGDLPPAPPLKKPIRPTRVVTRNTNTE